MPSLCGFRLWRSKADVSAASAPDHDQRPARPFSGETMVGSVSNLDVASVEEGKVTDRRTISGRFLSVGAALRERSRSPASKRTPYHSNFDNEKPTVTIPGPYSKDYSAGRIRSESITSLDTPTSPEDEKRWHHRDSKMKEESSIEETEAEARLRKMEDARRKFAQQQKEQERLDDFQLM